MAILTTEGTYLRVNKEALKQKLEQVQFHIYKDQATRQSPSEFDMVREEAETVSFTQEEIDSIVASIYTKLKEKERFSECTDV